ncbi:hypothetical protein QBC40DRAFT_338908 [Triangularia verruculosa]|uniref:Uncharacterized protein n=1 Tax=Triangularia verruculosa TaxID=2587418 RepID=A0AAN6XJ31_9PEZI|nr:hypothetical protein QBC40DRAFT_338908 [Triangularia verruculosa]
MSPDNNCKAYCETSHAWFWGHPRPMGVQSHHNMCLRSDNCGISVSLNGPIGETVTITTSNSASNTSSTDIKKSIDWKDSWTTTHGFDFSFGINAGASVGYDGKLQGVPVKANVGMDMSAGYKYSNTYSNSKSKALGKSWNSGVSATHSYGVSRSRSKSVGYSTGGSWQKEGWAKEYCGSWYAVPLLGMSCGRAAIGELMTNPDNGHTKCMIGKAGALDVCTSYGFEHELIPDDPRTRTVFVLRDCEKGGILPGEWQQSEFAYSISNMTDYYADHITRWGIRNLVPKEQNDRWVFQRQMDQKLFNFTKTIGVDDYNFKYCGANNFCVQLKLTKDSCYDIPRGHVEESSGKSAHVVSATVQPGHCCTLFSRHQCLGQAQRIMPGGQVNLADVMYEGLAHSVVCDTSEYCQTRQDYGYDISSNGD